MPKLNTIKYGHEATEELIACPHCRRKSYYRVEFHYENRPKKKEGHIVIPLELLETKVYDAAPPALCGECAMIPKCKDCGILLCNIVKHTGSWAAKGNPSLCESCWDWKIQIVIPT